MEFYTSDSSDTDSREQKTLDYGRLGLTEVTLEDDFPIAAGKTSRSPYAVQLNIETMLLNHNLLTRLPPAIKGFVNLKVLDLSSNRLTVLPEALCQLPLVTLIVKNNQLTDKSLPKSLLTKNSCLRELNLSGNMLTHFPEQVTELRYLKYFYAGGNKITTISKDIWKMHSLRVLSLGGNAISEVPDAVGMLSQLQALVLCDNQIEHLPMSIARLKNLKSLMIHKNRLKHLPKDIVALQNLTELSLRDNPLVVRFVQDMALSPPTLMELAARVVKANRVEYGPGDLPRSTLEYLQSANCCVNPNCKGVFFDNRVEHIKFVDFCGKYRVPLLQYLCSSKCIEPEQPHPQTSGASGYMMRKVLLG